MEEFKKNCSQVFVTCETTYDKFYNYFNIRINGWHIICF